LVDRVLEEEGHLDVFFANAGISQLRPIPRDESSGTEDDQVDPLVNELRLHARTMDAIGAEEFMEVMRINALRCVEVILRKNQGADP
jgi:NAD(P)-dependent dehydrogenase (short-subunit alcohol dehydrogenase family)